MSAPRKRLLVALYHSYIDSSSGAAISLRDMMEALAGRDWDIRVLSGPMLDFEREKSNLDLLKEQGIHCKLASSWNEGVEFRLAMFKSGGVQCCLWLPSQELAEPSTTVGQAWIDSYQEILNSWSPDVVLTYGGFWMTRPMMRLAKQQGAKTMFLLCNYAYENSSLFEETDCVMVRSHFHAAWCKRHLGIEGRPLYSLIPPERHLCQRSSDRQFVTFVNPQPAKGAFVFARIAEQLSRTRPDIPLLVVEGRGTSEWLAATGADLRSANLHRMRNTPDPRDYLSVTRIMLVPSVWQESFGRVAGEAMMNGIPVIASDRGSLPEVVGDGGMTLEIPVRITPESREIPTQEEVAGWIDAIVNYWDNQILYEETAQLARERAKLWSVDRILDDFEALAKQP